MPVYMIGVQFTPRMIAQWIPYPDTWIEVEADCIESAKIAAKPIALARLDERCAKARAHSERTGRRLLGLPTGYEVARAHVKMMKFQEGMTYINGRRIKGREDRAMRRYLLAIADEETA